METAITAQPVRSSYSDKPAEPPIEVLNNETLKEVQREDIKLDIKENLTEVTAVFSPNDTDEEEIDKKRRRREEMSDCCCYSPYYTDESDVFCLYLMCRWIGDCFVGIGRCTEDCFEGCANCLNGCCEDGGCCSDAGYCGDSCCCADVDGCGGCCPDCDGDPVASGADADCTGGCFECDCSS